MDGDGHVFAWGMALGWVAAAADAQPVSVAQMDDHHRDVHEEADDRRNEILVQLPQHMNEIVRLRSDEDGWIRITTRHPHASHTRPARYTSQSRDTQLSRTSDDLMI